MNIRYLEVFSSSFIQKIIDFDPLFCIMELNTMQKFWKINCHSPFWILLSRGKKKKNKKSLQGYNENNKLCILNETKYNSKNFYIYILSFQNNL
jgi:hypothetical protein